MTLHLAEISHFHNRPNLLHRFPVELGTDFWKQLALLQDIALFVIESKEKKIMSTNSLTSS